MYAVCIQVYIWTHNLSEAARDVKFKNEKMNSQHSQTRIWLCPSSRDVWDGHINASWQIRKMFSAINLTYGHMLTLWDSCDSVRISILKLK